MAEIVRKIEARTAPPATGGPPASLQATQDRELGVRVTGESLGPDPGAPQRRAARTGRRRDRVAATNPARRLGVGVR